MLQDILISDLETPKPTALPSSHSLWAAMTPHMDNYCLAMPYSFLRLSKLHKQPNCHKRQPNVQGAPHGPERPIVTCDKIMLEACYGPLLFVVNICCQITSIAHTLVHLWLLLVAELDSTCIILLLSRPSWNPYKNDTMYASVYQP